MEAQQKLHDLSVLPSYGRQSLSYKVPLGGDHISDFALPTSDLELDFHPHKNVY